ncbi:MAG: hypothetical protein IKD69_03410 [Solobacterium sp.]|nr:hypothetical protein [Solobacterium sp.]
MVKVQWYPGHMEKARRQMEERIKAVDMVIELRDARMPEASANPLLKSMTQNRPRLIVLTKTDMSDPVRTKEWEKKYSEEYGACISLNLARDNSCGKKVIRACLQLMKEKRE